MIHNGKYLFSQGELNPNWKGGQTIASNGYRLIRYPSHPMADSRGYVYEHRLVAAQKIGRLLEPSEIVHHIDGNKLNNSPDNLSIEPSRAYHAAKHRTNKVILRQPDEDNPLIECSCGCGEMLRKYDDSGRPRKFISGHNLHGRRKDGHQYKHRMG